MSIQQADLEVLEAAIQGIHRARVNHPILSIVATRTDSVVLAQAALAAIRAGGFKIVREAEPEISLFNDS
ncbi:MAG: hypothetical protein ACJ8FN_04410 [Sphingomicrobium sp.]|jgi:hypothetical protein